MTNRDDRVARRASTTGPAPARAIDPESRVIVVGSVNIDLVATIAHLPAPGETVTGGRFAQHHGGKGGNQAVAAARLGARTWFVGAIGRDGFGEAARNALEGEGVDVTELLTLPDQATGVALILVDAEGENSIAVAGGANGGITPAHVGAALDRLRPAPGDVVLVGHEIPTETATAALRHARTRGATTLLNPAPATGVTAEMLALTDVVTPNDGEATELLALTGRIQGAEGDQLAALVPDGHVLVTRGARGAVLVERGASLPIPAPPVQVIDTVGAGDTLNGALAAGLAAGLPVAGAARRAVIAASLAVTRAGAREGMPTLSELEAALAG